jgi:hypothetical protein
MPVSVSDPDQNSDPHSMAAWILIQINIPKAEPKGLTRAKRKEKRSEKN